jgi:hypothetical protein
MKRWIILAVLVVVLSTAATVAVQLMDASPVPGGPAFPVAASETARGSKAKAVLEGEPTFYFGTLPQRATGKHAWVVRNEGQSELILHMISSTCSCTLAKFKNGEKAVVPPGETTEIVLEYETRENNGDYEKGAEIGTNDPSLPQFSLHVRGKVFPAVVVYPSNTAIFGNITNDEDDNRTLLALYSKDRPQTKVLKATSSRPKDLTVDFEPLEKKDAQQLGAEEGGYKLTFHARPGLPLGSFREEVILTTDHPKQPEVKVTVVGKMSGPVNLIPDRLFMHQVNGKTGGRGDMIIAVRGGRETKCEVVKAPKGLEVGIAPAGGTSKGRYKLTVEVPPGTPAREIEGEIVIKTDHPRAATVTAPVSVWVQNPS